MFRTLAEAEAFLRERTDYERMARPPGWRPDLEPVRALLRVLGNPERRFRVVHVAGSKGKGSTATFAALLLRALGARAGLYTSPHLERLVERIAVDGRPIAEADFARALGRVAGALPRTGPEAARATFFDLVTASAFLHFAEAAVEWAVVEVGLGGRLDSTNVVSPEICVITNVTLEHTDVLGDRLEDVAREKAGIVKPGVPVVCGIPAGSPARAVVEAICRERGAPLATLGEDFAVERAEPLPGRRLHVAVRILRGPLEVVLPGPARYQATNLALALASLEALEDRRRLPAGALPEALRRAAPDLRLPGRFEVFEGSPPVVLDGAHTPEAVAEAVATLENAFPGRRAVLVFAAQADKDARAMLSLLRARADTVFVTTASNPRSAPLDALAEAARGAGLRTAPEQEPAAALRRAREAAGADGVVVALGSLYLVGALRRELRAPGEKDRC